jgi:hypothetical protein
MLKAEIGVGANESIEEVKNRSQQMAGPEEEGGLPKAMTASEAGRAGGRGNKKASDNVTSFIDDRGNTASYLVRRLKRDNPDVAQALARGEYKSARAAGIATGIVKVPTALEVAAGIVRRWPRMATPWEKN